MLSKKSRPLPTRPEPPKWDSIIDDVEYAPDDDVAFSFFRRSNNLLDESVASIETQIGREQDISPTSPMTPASPTSPFHGAIDAMGLRRRFGDVIGGGSPVKDACDREEAAAAAKLEEERQNVEENYRKVLNFLEANRKLQKMLGLQEDNKGSSKSKKTGVKVDNLALNQSFESVGDAEDSFREPLDDEGLDSITETSICGLVDGGDTIAECYDHLPKDKLDNFKDLVSKLDQLKSELSYELSELIDKTTTS